MQGLYAIIDVQALAVRDLELRPFAEALLAAHPVALQLRDKQHAAGHTLEGLRSLRMLIGDRNTLLVANDRPDLAALANADLVHLGQSDLPIDDARTVLKALDAAAIGIGTSVHNTAELSRSLAGRPDYLAFGPVFRTASKKFSRDAEADPTLRLSGLRQLASRGRGLPMVAIGGIDLESAEEVAAICGCCAVISALLPADPGLHGLKRYQQVYDQARALQAAIKRGIERLSRGADK